ncbi:MAG TPA: STAS/SEC14 domain-containing protein [Steroidobacteraceae bacterium]|jgi:hypothetical protein
MGIRCKVEVHPEHVLLSCSGTYTLDEALRVYALAFEEAVKAGRLAVLVDVREVTGREPSLTERYDQGIKVAELQLRYIPRIRFALLGREPLIHPERFGEIVAIHRGAQARVFTDLEAAREWLLPRPKPR